MVIYMLKKAKRSLFTLKNAHEYYRVRGGESVLGRIRGFLVLGMKDKNFNQLKIVQTRHVAYQTKAYCLSFPFL